MKNLNSLSLRETLTIAIPGAFIMLSFIPLISNIESEVIDITNRELNLLLISMGSFFIGIILYIIDFPKKIFFFNNATPTELINKNLKELNNKIDVYKLHNAYFQFYDKEISTTQKNKTNSLTSMYHFSINILVSSLIILIVYCVNRIFTGSTIIYWIPISIMGLLSLISALGLFYGKRKIKYYFTRQYKAFIQSEYYNELNN